MADSCSAALYPLAGSARYRFLKPSLQKRIGCITVLSGKTPRLFVVQIGLQCELIRQSSRDIGDISTFASKGNRRKVTSGSGRGNPT